MNNVLNEYELRVLGAMVEKQIATPDYYPLTLNAIVNACNQKNHRDPVVTYDEATVVRALDGLKGKNLAYVFHGADARVPKYGHLFAKVFELNEAETALMCVLALRGPQTPGELRSRSGHLRAFENLPEVETYLHELASRAEPLIIKLPRQVGSRESRFAHLLAGEINIEAFEQAAPTDPPPHKSKADNDRAIRLEEEVASLRLELNELKQQLAEFRKQFE